MFDPFLLAAPLLLAPVVGLLRFIGCTFPDIQFAPPSLKITPDPVGLGPAETQQFTAQEEEGPSANVTWSCKLGSISDTGLYTAPDPWVADLDAVTATSKANADATGSATVNLIHATVIVTPAAVDLKPGETTTFTAAVKDTPDQAVQWLSSIPGMPDASGLFAAPSPFVLGAGPVTVKAVSHADASAIGSADVNLIGSGAVFIASDTVTQGNWNGAYGAAGWTLANTPGNLVSLPDYLPALLLSSLKVTISADPTVDLRGLLKPPAFATRFSASWRDSVLTVDLDFADFKTHRIAVYFVDWESAGRTQKVEVLDNSQVPLVVLDTQNLAAFAGGVYLIWDVAGQVRLSVTRVTGVNAVISGIFFQ
jgi:hypothetical protein